MTGATLSSKYFELKNGVMTCSHPKVISTSTYGSRTKYDECDLDYQGLIIRFKNGKIQKWGFLKSIQKFFNCMDKILINDYGY